MNKHPLLTFIVLILMLMMSCNLNTSQEQQPAVTETVQAPRPTSSDPSPILPTLAPANIAAGAPRLFFTDLESGPNTGGEGGLGVFISIYGEGFGSERGASTVTIGGQEVTRYVQWGADNAPRMLDMIIVQPGPGVNSGEIVVSINGEASNPLPFTVRPGNIYFVSNTGYDSGNGNTDQPWRTIAFAKTSLAAGDTVYVMDGVIQSSEDNYGAALSLESSGEEGAPKAMIAYPGAIATIGSTGMEFGIRVPNVGIAASDWVIAKFVLRGAVQAVDMGGDGSSRWRVVGNDISCPAGDGHTGCFAASLANHIHFLGNEVHDSGKGSTQPSKQYHAVYFSTDTNHVEVGWNHIHDNLTCRSLQFHSSPLNETTGYNQYDLIVHDNLIHGDVCDGINFATVDPSKGPVRAFNNIIYNVGRGPTPPDGDANYTCIFVAGGTNTGADGTGSVDIFNNTLYDCGRVEGVPADNVDHGAFGRGPGSPGLMMTLTNNIVYLTAGEDPIAPSSDTTLITGSNNMWFNGQNLPAFLAGNLEADPLFMDISAGNFHLQPGSPAIDSGLDMAIGFDYDYRFRPQGNAYDIGAYEVATAP
jgi:hypothetical protein